MSLSSQEKRNFKVPTFNGNPEHFPLFNVKFKALIYRLGPNYVKALNGQKPYHWQVYGEPPTDPTQDPILADVSRLSLLSGSAYSHTSIVTGSSSEESQGQDQKNTNGSNAGK